MSHFVYSCRVQDPESKVWVHLQSIAERDPQFLSDTEQVTNEAKIARWTAVSNIHTENIAPELLATIRAKFCKPDKQ